MNPTSDKTKLKIGINNLNRFRVHKEQLTKLDVTMLLIQLIKQSHVSVSNGGAKIV